MEKSLKGTIKLPGDKSISHRAALIGAISSGTTFVENFLFSQDCLSSLNAVKELGIEVKQIPTNNLEIYGNGLYGLKQPQKFIDAGNSGTTARLIAGILSAQPFSSVITGDDSLKKRPMKRIIQPLKMMGAKIEATQDNFLPLKIQGGKINPLNYVSSLASAQVKSCILLAGLYAQGETSVSEPIKSRDHTERMLEYLGVELKTEDKTVRVKGVSQPQAKKITIPGDISSAAFFIVGAIILKKSHLIIEDVGINPTRTGIIDVLSKMGAKINIKNKRVYNNEPVADLEIFYSSLKGCEIEEEMVPRLIDEIPILAVAATQAQGLTCFRGIQELRFKETDRINAISTQLSKLGANIQETSDGIIVKGKTVLRGAQVDSFSDHRMAMALTIAGLVSSGEIKIKNQDCIKVSFPNFRQILEKILEGK